jgi:hypothetical protein
VVVRFDQRHELADADRVREIVQHEPDSTGREAPATVVGESPPGHLGGAVGLKAGLTAADWRSRIGCADGEAAPRPTFAPLPLTIDDELLYTL